MKAFHRAAWSVALVLGGSMALVATAGAARHNRLLKAVPGVDSTVKASPATIRLWFKEPADVAVSGIRLADAAGKDVPLGPVKATSEPGSIESAVPGALGKGKYTVTWKTASKDGHVIRGSYGFTLAP